MLINLNFILGTLGRDFLMIVLFLIRISMVSRVALISACRTYVRHTVIPVRCIKKSALCTVMAECCTKKVQDVFL